MAFCPECGKPVAVDAPTCEKCGHALRQHQPKKPRAARFNGTMMMAAVSIKPPAPANANIPQQAAAKPSERPMANAGMRSGSTPPAAEKALESARAKPGPKLGKATMLGVAAAPLMMQAKQGLQAAQASLAAAAAPVQAALSEPHAHGLQHVVPNALAAELQRAPANANEAATLDMSADQAAAMLSTMPPVARIGELEAEVVPASMGRELGLYLPGTDPQPSAAVHAGHSTRLRLPNDEPFSVPKNEKAWLYWAVCAAVVVSVMFLAFGFGLF